MADFWKLGSMVWCLTVIGWVLSPILTFLVNKFLTKVVHDTSRKLRQLEFHTVPDLEQTLGDVEEKSKLIAAKDSTSKSLDTLDKMKKSLKSALYEAEDILDLVDYHRIAKKVRKDGKRHGRIWVKQLHDVARCIPLTQAIEITLFLLVLCMVAIATLLRRFTGAIQSLCRRFTGAIVRWRSSGAEACSAPADQDVSTAPSIHIAIPEAISTSISEPISIADDIQFSTIKCLHWFHFRFMDISTCCRAMLSWLANAVAWVHFFRDWLAKVVVVARSYRDWSYEEVGINIKQEDDTGLDSFLLTINRRSLRKRIEHIEYIVTDSKKSDLLKEESSSSKTPVNDTSNKESSSKREDIDDLHRSIKRKVFGRDREREDICRMLREGPSLTSSKHYSVIGIHGIAGSGKSTLAQYICDYEKGQDNKHFDNFMFIRVSTSFSLDDIFRDMLKQMTKHQPSGDKGLDILAKELKKKLRGRRFLLVLDNVWVNEAKDRKSLDILQDVLNSGGRGSGVLVTAQREDAARALGAEKEKLIAISNLEEKQYFSMFMYHALQNSGLTDDGKHRVIGKKIAEKLDGSPIAAVTVAARLRTNTCIQFWEDTASDDVLNETMEEAMGALLWSYQQLSAGARRCFQYCSTFPRGYKLERDELVRMWTAQGLVSTSNATFCANKYFDELLTFSFLQIVQRTYYADEYFTMHDLRHKLSERVAGSDFFRFDVNGSPNDIPPEVRHLHIETDNFAGIMDKILQLGNLRTLIIEEAYMRTLIIEKADTASEDRARNNLVKEIFFRNMFMKLRKLRVFIVKIQRYRELELSFPRCIGQMKHLRYLSFRSKGWGFGRLKLIFPCTFSELYHMQILDIPECQLSCAEDIADLVQLRHLLGCSNLPNIVMPMSVETIPCFEVRTEQGYELKKLEHLQKLRALQIRGLGFVGSKEEAREANLATKNQLKELELDFYRYGGACDPDIQAAVLEGLCPSKDLVHLNIEDYSGLSYPSWMLCPSWSGQDSRDPKELYSIELFRCSRLVSIPEGSEYFIRLHKLCFSRCRWSCLPDNMERLTSLQELTISLCGRIKRLPMLPQSLKLITITGYCKLWKLCQREGHENWEKIQHIPKKEFPVISED